MKQIKFFIIALVVLFASSKMGVAQCAVTAPVPNDACYQQVIANDTWCCNNDWDGICQDAYDVCNVTPPPPPPPGSGCNTNVSICTGGVAGPFGFATASFNPSSCLDFTNGASAPNYAYIILYITQGGDLNLLIDGDQATGCLDVSIFDITGQADPCSSLGTATEIGCNYASNCDGCNEFGSNFPCLSEVAAPVVSVGDVIMILVEDWSDIMTSFTLELSNAPGSAQTGPGIPDINPAGPFMASDPPVAITAVNGGGVWSSDCGACIDPVTGVFDPSVAGNGTWTICYDLGVIPCDVSDCETIIVGSCTAPDINPLVNFTGCDSYTLPPITGTELTGGEAYFTGSGGTGTQYNAGQVITANATLFIYDEESSTCWDEETFTISLDVTDPTMNCPGNLIAVCSIAEYPPYANYNDYIGAGGTANDDTNLNTGSFILLSETSNGANCPEIVTRIYEIADECGHTITCAQTITINDLIPPIFDPQPADVAYQCSADVPAGADLAWNDNCDGTGMAIATDVSDGASCPETITRTWTYTDACGNITTVSQSIIVDDTTDPTATNPTAQAGFPPVFDPTQVTDAADNCSVPTVTDGGDISDGGVCPEIITREYIITDACLNTISVFQTFTVGDPIIPTATDPLPINVECYADVLAPDPTVVTDENDNGATPTVAWEDDTSDGLSCPEAILRRYRVTDDCGNFIFVTQTITVDDTQVPVFDPQPADVTVQCSADVPVAADLVWNDNCDGTGMAVATDVSDGANCPEVITRTWTYTDACGNIATISQIITVDDTQVPVFDPQPADVAFQCSADVPVAAGLAWNDNCDGTGMAVATDVSNGANCPEVITRTWTYTDACGNIATVSQIITIDDTQIPVFDPQPADVAVQCSADVPVAVDLAWNDNCDGAGVAVATDVSDGLSCPEKIERTWTYTDACGNIATVLQTIIVDDTTDPTASNLPSLSVPGLMDVPAANVNDVFDEADNCTTNPIVTIEGNDVSDGNVCNGEIITRTYRITDDCGNFILVTQLITIEAIYPPLSIEDQVICEGSSTTLVADNPMGVPISWDNGVQDGVLFTPTQTNTYTVTADNFGCFSIASSTISIEELPTVDFIVDTLSGCEPLTVVFSNLSEAGTNGNLETCIWDIEGAFNSISGCNDVSYTFGSGGSYDVTLTTTTETGCVNSLTYADYIYVEDSPIASFTVSDNAVSVLNTEVDFTNTSVGAVNYQWTFGDETSGTTDIHPSHTFPNIEANGYTVELIVHSPIGCVDTARLIVMVEEELIFYIPNTFTPDGDAFNNTFQPVFTSGFDPFDFNMLIFNRWGEVIFETNDAKVGWDGTYLAGKGLVQDGTYTWRIEFKQIKNDKRLVKTGQVSIFK